MNRQTFVKDGKWYNKGDFSIIIGKDEIGVYLGDSILPHQAVNWNFKNQGTYNRYIYVTVNI